MYDIGIDIGGTTIKVGLVSDGAIIRRANAPFPRGGGALAAVKLMCGLVNDVLKISGVSQGELKSIGMAVPGSVSDGVVKDAYNLDFHDVPLMALMQGCFPNTEVFLANDADAAALAELVSGVFVGAKTAILLTLGTGVGGGVILNGMLHPGGLGNGVEIGHMVLCIDGEGCTCGNSGCIEAYCAASALARHGHLAAAPGNMLYDGLSGDTQSIDAHYVIDCARSGDKTAIDVFSRYTYALGTACASFINMMSPDVIALGGGVSHAGDFLLSPITSAIKELIPHPFSTKILLAKSGNDAGILGAAWQGWARTPKAQPQ